MLVFLSVIENIVVFCPSFLFFFAHVHVVLLTTQKSRRAEKNFIMPGHYKKIMPAQQPIRARVLLQPYNNEQEYTFFSIVKNIKYWIFKYNVTYYLLSNSFIAVRVAVLTDSKTFR